MSHFSVSGRCLAAPPPADWREQLTLRLGAKPRRIGTWAELGLYGALRCMADAGEKTLPSDAILLLTSRRGTCAAAGAALEQMRAHSLMPLTFLQTQPSQLLALLAAQLEWTGHGCFVAAAQPQDLLRLAAVQAGAGGVLLGWVDEAHGGFSNWLRLRRNTVGKYDLQDAFADWMPRSDATPLGEADPSAQPAETPG